MYTLLCPGSPPPERNGSLAALTEAYLETFNCFYGDSAFLTFSSSSPSFKLTFETVWAVFDLYCAGADTFEEDYWVYYELKILSAHHRCPTKAHLPLQLQL